MRSKTNPLSRYLDKAGMRQADFARLLGVSSGVVCRWAKGDRVPNRQYALAIERQTAGVVRVEDWDQPRAA